MASADLGGLGAKTGAPVAYNWVLPSLAPQLLPWLVLLGMLALKPNRRGSAWLIWLPVAGALALTLVPLTLPSGTDAFLDVFAALVFGVAAVWLLSGYLRQSHRLLTFFCVLVTLAGFSLLAFVAKQSLNELDFEFLPFAILLGVGVLTSAVALSLDGWICRRRFQPLALYLWLFISLVAVWLLIATPFFLIAVLSSNGATPPWSEFFIPLFAVAAGNFALLLPFLILSSANPFFRERLKSLLHAQPAAAPPPPMSEPAAATSLPT